MGTLQLFGDDEDTSHLARAKTLAKADAPTRAVTRPPLTAAQLEERDRNLSAMRAERAEWRIGDTRAADNPCPACGRERIERLEDIASEGGQTWAMMCVTVDCKRRATR
jgi:hypothetical protein